MCRWASNACWAGHVGDNLFWSGVHENHSSAPLFKSGQVMRTIHKRNADKPENIEEGSCSPYCSLLDWQHCIKQTGQFEDRIHTLATWFTYTVLPSLSFASQPTRTPGNRHRESGRHESIDADGGGGRMGHSQGCRVDTKGRSPMMEGEAISRWLFNLAK